jgi:transposase
VKTDRRDPVRLTLMHRAGLLTPVRVPSRAGEAVRDLVRARGDLLDDRKRMQQRADKRLRKAACRDTMVDWLYSHDAVSPMTQPARDEMLSDLRWGVWRRRQTCTS